MLRKTRGDDESFKRLLLRKTRGDDESFKRLLLCKTRGFVWRKEFDAPLPALIIREDIYKYA